MGALRQTGVLAAVALLLFSGQALGANADVIQSWQDEFRSQEEDDADLRRALRPHEGLNANRSGGLNLNDSIR